MGIEGQGYMDVKRLDTPPGIEFPFELTLDEVLNRALGMPQGMGVILRFADARTANNYRARLYARVVRERRGSLKRSVDDPMWGKTQWDGLSFLRATNRLWIGSTLFTQSQPDSVEEGTKDDLHSTEVQAGGRGAELQTADPKPAEGREAAGGDVHTERGNVAVGAGEHVCDARGAGAADSEGHGGD